MKYEGQVHELLQSKYADMYLPSPWIYFYDNARTLRYCQPDGLIFNFIRGRITIVEAKLRHTPQAYHQLFSLYRPLLRHMFPEHLWTIRCIEICKWYDMATVIPGPHQLRRDIEDADCDSMGVYIYAGK